MTKKHRKPISKKRKTITPRLVSYEITWDPMPDAKVRQLPQEARDALERLHDEIKAQPAKTIPELRQLIEQYPDVPQFYNYLSTAYNNAGQREKAFETVMANYRRNPDYLFARLNYAEICFAQGDYEKVAEIFDHKLDLKLLYPERNVFHISEVMNFMGLMGAYYVKTGQLHAAEMSYDMLKQLDPDSIMTQRLHRLLFPGPIRRWIETMKKNLENR